MKTRIYKSSWLSLRKRIDDRRVVEAPVLLEGGDYRDLIARAIERERGFGRVSLPECERVVEHVFTCVCCGKICGDQERREPRSEVCVRCEQDAGFFN